MKIFSINNLLIFVVAAIVYPNGWQTYGLKEVAVDDVKFVLYRHQFVSLEEQFIGLVEKP